MSGQDQGRVLQGYANFYGVLSVDPDADERTIKRAYRSAVKKVHPDVSDDPDEAMLDVLQVARDVLVDDRDRYDQLGHNQYVRLHLNGKYHSPKAEPHHDQRPGGSSPSTGSSSEDPPAPQPGEGPDVTAKEDVMVETDETAGDFSRDEAFDFLQDEQVDRSVNAPDHVIDTLHQTWLTRAGIVLGGLMVGAILTYLGGPMEVGGLDRIADVVSSMGVPTSSLLYTAVLVVGGFLVTGRRAIRQLYRGGEETSPPSLFELKLGAVLVALALVVTILGGGTEAWHYANSFLLGQSRGGSPWINTSGLVAQGVTSVAVITLVVGAVGGTTAVVTGVTQRAWHARFIDGKECRPYVWELGGSLPLLAVFWGVIFGAASVEGMLGGIIGGVTPFVVGDGTATFGGLGILGTAVVLVVAIGHHVRLR